MNLEGIRPYVPYLNYALATINDEELPGLGPLTEEQGEVIESSAEILFGLLHARYILTEEGMRKMSEKYQKGIFGRCPHISCENQSCLPLGRSDIPRQDCVKLYCPKCRDLYIPKRAYKKMDGAHFGPTFANLLLSLRTHLLPNSPPSKYIPKIFGFRIHETVPHYKTVTKIKHKQKT